MRNKRCTRTTKVGRMFSSTFHAATIYNRDIKLLWMLSTAISASLSFSYLVKFLDCAFPIVFITVLSRFSRPRFRAMFRTMRISVSVRLKSPARMRRGDSLSEPTATRLLRMHRGRDVVMRLQRHKCNGTNTPHLFLLPLITTVLLHAPCIARFSSSNRFFNIDRIVAMDRD